MAGRMGMIGKGTKVEGKDVASLARRGWQEYSGRFPADTDCLASFLALEGAEVLQGEKPANLLSLANRSRDCGRNLYELWRRHGQAVVQGSGLEVKALADRGSAVLLLIYRREALRTLLAQRSVQIILSRAGYSEPHDLDNTLTELESRVQGDLFPHEIGVFLGYPLKDVVGFMGWARLSFTCQGPWKIFGDPKESLELAARFRRCRGHVSQLLDSGCNPHDCLRGACAVPPKYGNMH